MTADIPHPPHHPLHRPLSVIDLTDFGDDAYTRAARIP